jgi:peptidoglycan/LPS O-acetylase OafA/YrhL
VLRRRSAANTQATRNFGVHGRPSAFVAMLLVVSALVYVPLELAFGAERWLTLGPFSFQVSRLLFYATYFLVGLQMGASGTESGLLARHAELVRRWPIWLSAGLAAYALQLAVIITLILPVVGAHRALPLTPRLLSYITLVLCCGTISFAFIAVFRRFVVAREPVFDSLSASSYGIYLIHYPIVVWLQFALLAVALGPIAKGAIVFVGAVALRWEITAALGRVPMIARLI